MTAFIPTTRITIRRGVLAANEFGDEHPADEIAAEHVPAAVTEGASAQGMHSQRSHQPAAMRGGVVETFTVRFRPDADVREDDRLVDEITGAVYQARAIYSPHSVVGAADIRVVAVRTGAASQPVNS